MKHIKLFESYGINESLESVNQLKEINKKNYDDMLEVMPPIYIKTVDGIKVNGGFAVSEPYSSFGNLPTFGIYFKYENKYYTAIATLAKADGKTIGFPQYNNCEYTKDNVATSVKK